MPDNTYIGPPVRPQAALKEGDAITVIIDATVTNIDADLGIVTVEGNARGAEHVTWSFDLHWGTEFYVDDGVREMPER